MVQSIYDMQKGPIEKRVHAVLRFMMRLLTHKRVNVSLALSIFAISAFYSISVCSWEHVSRCGSLITVMGILIMERRSLRLGPDIVFHFNRSSLDNEKPPLTHEQEDDEIVNVNTDVGSAYWGFSFVLMGTVIWGYGDVIAQRIIPL